MSRGVIPILILLAIALAFLLGGKLKPAPHIVGNPAAVEDVGGLKFEKFRAKLNAELDRRAGLPAGHPDRITADECQRAKDVISKLGDGRLLDFLIKYGPDIIRLIAAILALL